MDVCNIVNETMAGNFASPQKELDSQLIINLESQRNTIREGNPYKYVKMSKIYNRPIIIK